MSPIIERLVKLFGDMADSNSNRDQELAFRWCAKAAREVEAEEIDGRPV